MFIKRSVIDAIGYLDEEYARRITRIPITVSGRVKPAFGSCTRPMPLCSIILPSHQTPFPKKTAASRWSSTATTVFSGSDGAIVSGEIMRLVVDTENSACSQRRQRVLHAGLVQALPGVGFDGQLLLIGPAPTTQRLDTGSTLKMS